MNGMFAGTCLGVILAVLLFTLTEDALYILLIPAGFLIGVGLCTVRCMVQGNRER